MTYTNKILRNEYMEKAQDIGSNAITLVNEYFDVAGGIEDKVNGDYFQWTLTDLDRALNEMKIAKLSNVEKFVMTFLEDEFINSSGAFERAINNKEEWKGLKS